MTVLLVFGLCICQILIGGSFFYLLQFDVCIGALSLGCSTLLAYIIWRKLRTKETS